MCPLPSHWPGAWVFQSKSALWQRCLFPGDARPEWGLWAADGTLLLNHELIHVLALAEAVVEGGIEDARKAIEQRREAFRDFSRPPALEGKTAIFLDDGLATGYTALTAIESLRPLGPGRIVVASPVGSIYALEVLSEAGVEVVVLTSGDGPFFDVSSYYGDFEELDDSQVLRLLKGEQQGARAAS